MQQACDKATFLRLFALLQSEIVLRISEEKTDTSRIERRVEFKVLDKLRQHCEVQAMSGLVEAEQLAGAMTRASSDLRRSMLGLDTIRVMGRVESGRLGAEGNRIGATIDQIDECHSGIIGLLQKIMDNSLIVSCGVNAIRSQSTTKFTAPSPH